MQEPVRERLCAILDQHGTDLVHQPERLIPLLRHACSGYPTKTDLLVGALTHECVADLLRWRDQLPPAKLVSKLAANLQARLGCSQGEALWTMVSWALALKLMTEAETLGITIAPSSEPQTAASPAIGTRPPQPSAWEKAARRGPFVAGALIVAIGLFLAFRCIDSLVKVEKPGAPRQTALDPKKEKVRFEPVASWRIERQPYDLTFRGDEGALFSLGGDSVLTKWDPGTGAAMVTIRPPAVPAGNAILSPDGRTLVARSRTYEGLDLFDAVTLTSLGAIKGGWGFDLQGAMSPDGKFLATGGEVGRLQTWDLVWKRPIQSMSGKIQSSMQEALSYAPDGRSILVPNIGGSPPGILEAGLDSIDFRIRFEGHKGLATAAVFDRDGTRVATASSGDGTVRIWNARTGKEIRRLEVEGAQDVAFHPDLPLLFSRIGNGGVRVWNTDSGEEVGRLSQTVSTMALSPDGSLFATGCWEPVEDKTKAAPSAIKIWRVNTSALGR